MKRLVLFLLLFSVVVSAQPQVSEDILYPRLPRWEAGVGLGIVHLPDYPGADEERARYLPLPFFVYRGEVIRSDRDGGLRGRFINSERLEFDLSFGAAFPARSENNSARTDMPDLDWMGEIGPRLIYHLYKGRMIKLDFALPIRYAFSTDMRDFDFQGYVFDPEIKFRHRALFDADSFFSASMGPIWATEELMDYFYEVSPTFVTAERPLYDAESGFMGFNTSVSFGRKFPNHVTAFVGVSKNYYADAANRGSPLLRDIETESYFFGIVWTFMHSSEDSHDRLLPDGND